MAEIKVPLMLPAPKPKRKMGRPSKYKKDIIEVVESLSRHFCANDIAIAAVLKIPVRTFGRWKVGHPEIEDAKKRGREQARVALTSALYKIAVTEQNLEAIKFVLKTQYGREWQDVQSIIKNYNLNAVNVDGNNGKRNEEDAIAERRRYLAEFNKLIGGNGESHEG